MYVLIVIIFIKLLLTNISYFIQEYEASCNANRKGEIDGLTESIENQKTEIWRTEAQKHVIQAKRENVAIQLEAIYRERALQAYNQVLYFI